MKNILAISQSFLIKKTREMNQVLGKKTGSAMTQSELQEDRIHTLDRKNRHQWRDNLASGSELKKDFSSSGPMKEDTNAGPKRCCPGPLSDRNSAQCRVYCPEIFDMKYSTPMKCAAFEDEYQSLPSPARCSLQAKPSPSQSKEGVRVTFAQDYPDGYCRKKNGSSRTEDLLSSAAETPEAWCFSPYPRRGPSQPGSLPGPMGLTEITGRHGNARTIQPCSDLCPYHAPSQLPLTQTAAPDPEMVLDPTSSSLSEGTSGGIRKTCGITPSDLSVVTHLPEEVSCFRNFLELSHCQGSSHRSLSLDRLLDGLSPGTQGSPQGRTTQRHSPPASPSGLENEDLQSLSLSLHSTASAYHPLTAKNDPAMDREGLDLGLREGKCPARTPPPPISELSSVLRQLLELVDQHWRGPCSLKLNPRFLTPAYDLLASLVSHSPVQCDRGRSPWRLKDVDKTGERAERIRDSMTLGLNCPDPIYQKNQPMQTHQQMESLKKRVTTVLEKRNSLRCQIVNSKPGSTFNVFESGRQWDQCLQRQVKALREQERHFKQLKETMGLLQESHRSLVSSNNSLMEQLKSPSSTQNTDTWKCVSHHDMNGS